MQNNIHIIVDMINDFISGSLACENAENAVEHTVNYINEHPDDLVVYICDHHPINHCSFKINGGIWPEHCVKGTFGSLVHSSFGNIKKESNTPGESNIFRKGENPLVEEYSGFNAKNINGELLNHFLTRNKVKNLIISGIATEYCVKETVCDLHKAGYNITLLTDNLAYVNRQGHLDTLKELEKIIKC